MCGVMVIDLRQTCGGLLGRFDQARVGAPFFVIVGAHHRRDEIVTVPVNYAVRYSRRVVAQVMVSPFLVVVDAGFFALDRIIQAAFDLMRGAEQGYDAVAGDRSHYAHVADSLARKVTVKLDRPLQCITRICRQNRLDRKCCGTETPWSPQRISQTSPIL